MGQINSLKIDFLIWYTNLLSNIYIFIKIFTLLLIIFRLNKVKKFFYLKYFYICVHYYIYKIFLLQIFIKILLFIIKSDINIIIYNYFWPYNNKFFYLKIKY